MAVLIVALALAGLFAPSDALRFSIDRSGELPMTKVVNLLETMKTDLEKEAKEDKELYEGLTCWCQSNEQKKSQAVEDARQKLLELQSTIEGASGSLGALSSEIKQLEGDIAEGKQALAEATALRKKEAAASHAQEVEAIQSIALLRGAITALSKHHPSMLQSEEDALQKQINAMRPSLRRLVHRHLPTVDWLRNSPRKDAFLRFISANSDILEPDGTSMSLIEETSDSALSYKSFAPQSGKILGVLKQLKEDFEENVPAIQKEEAQKQQAFAEVKGSKESEIATNEQALRTKTTALASAKDTIATAKSDRKATQASLDADQRFLLEMTERCTEGDHEYERRTKLRGEEIAAVQQAIVILSADKVKDGQQTTFGFVQLRSSSSSQRAALEGTRHEAITVLRRLVASPEVALLAVNLQSQPFAQVIKAIDGLAEKLKVEQADEVTHKDFCVAELDENTQETARKNHQFKSLEAKIADLDAKIKLITTDIETLRTELADLQIELQTAGEQRKAESIEFQKAMREQTTTRTALEEAIKVLASVYMKKSPSFGKAALLQKEPAVDKTIDQPGAAGANVAPAPEFIAYKQHEGKNSVLGVIQKLLGETKVIIDDSNHDEQQAQIAYEKLVSDTNDSVKTKLRLIGAKSEELASTREAKSSTAADKERTGEDLDGLAETKTALETQCSFLLNNFADRQEARAEEIKGLHTVKAILSGMQAE